MRLNIGVIFGGESIEHEMSILSACEVMSYMSDTKYNVIPIYIGKDGVWYTGSHLKDIINYRDIALVKRYAKKVSIVKEGKSVILKSFGLIPKKLFIIDMFFPIGHGNNLEDGTIQGYLNTLGLPYIGSGVKASVLGIDKILTKEILNYYNIPTSNFCSFNEDEYLNNKKDVMAKINKLKYPIYIKPSTLGSSIGIVKVDKEEEIHIAIKEALGFSKTILVEEEIKNTKEVCVSVLGDSEKQEVSNVEDVCCSKALDNKYSKIKCLLNEKYIEKCHKSIKDKKDNKNPIISKEMLEDMKRYAKEIFKIIGASGVAKIDFLIDEKNKKIFVSEIDTNPSSLCIGTWNNMKKTPEELIKDLIDIAVKNKEKQKDIVTSFPTNLLENYDIELVNKK
jgi:D-alanine-D-alanine ligase and related ATP-grasp enzymes